MVKRQIINGALLGKHTGGNVSLTVFVEQEVQRSSTHFSAKTSDDQIVEVNLNEPLNTPVKGWIEVLGKPKSTYSIQTDEIILFPEDESNQEFDKTAHNSLVLFLQSCSDIFSPEAYEDKFL